MLPPPQATSVWLFTCISNELGPSCSWRVIYRLRYLSNLKICFLNYYEHFHFMIFQIYIKDILNFPMSRDQTLHLVGQVRCPKKKQTAQVRDLLWCTFTVQCYLPELSFDSYNTYFYLRFLPMPFKELIISLIHIQFWERNLFIKFNKIIAQIYNSSNKAICIKF